MATVFTIYTKEAIPTSLDPDTGNPVGFKLSIENVSAVDYDVTSDSFRYKIGTSLPGFIAKDRVMFIHPQGTAE